MELINTIGNIISSFGIFSSIISVLATNFYGKDLYEKAHCAGINDSFSIPLIIVGLIISNFNIIISSKLSILIIFIMITCATSCHCICTLHYKNNKINK